MAGIPSYVRDRVTRPYPPDAHVVPGSTPVIAFGNPSTCDVATLGINPSRIEFQTQRRAPLVGDKRRLADLASLGAEDTQSLSPQQVSAVVDGCYAYFQTNPYSRWFDKLNEILAGVGRNYYSGTACHLDIVQWATDPVWSGFPQRSLPARDRLLHDDSKFLKAQLSAESIRLVLVNGRTVANWLAKAGIVIMSQVGRTPVGKQGKQSELLAGEAFGVEFLGWTLNANHSQTTRDNRAALARWLADRWGS